MNRTFVALDLETTGLDPGRDAILEVGAVRFRTSFDDGTIQTQVLDTWSSLVNPGRHIPIQIQQLTGITEKEVSRAPRFSQVIQEVDRFVGRLPVTASLDALSEDELVRILTEPRNSMIKQYIKLLAMEGVKLSFTDTAVREIARIAHDKGTGARGLRAILEHIMLDVMYEVPMKEDVKECRITKAVVKGQRAVLNVDKSLKIAS